MDHYEYNLVYFTEVHRLISLGTTSEVMRRLLALLYVSLTETIGETHSFSNANVSN